jgi:putative FmdB family regulatory protein
MPIYAYRCSCGTEFDDQKTIAERATSACPSCGLDAPAYIAAVSFSLKGSGWASDGYGRHATGADLRSGRLKPSDLADIPVVGADGKLRNKSGDVIAG